MPAAVWQLATGVREKVFAGRRTFQYMAFARDGESLFLGGDHDVSLWRMQPVRRIRHLRRPSGRGLGGRLLARRTVRGFGGRRRRPADLGPGDGPRSHRADEASGDGLHAGLSPRRARDRLGEPRAERQLRLWDAGDRPARSPRSRATRIASGRSRSAPTDGCLASAGSDRTIRLWDGATGAAHRRPRRPREVVRQVAFSPDGLSLWPRRATTGRSGSGTSPAASAGPCSPAATASDRSRSRPTA